jgi:prepilin-type N-terminal cleavage/methylation domain-containing protein
MNTQQKNKEKGFTIIEVVLVLAIAGLIFLMVFIALPALQRGQRDTQRRQDLSRVLTKINDYQANNRGSLPTNWDLFKSQYLVVGGDTFTDPSGGDYTFDEHDTSAVSGSFSNDQHIVYYTIGATCTQDGGVTAASNRKVALRMILEGGGVACVNN